MAANQGITTFKTGSAFENYKNHGNILYAPQTEGLKHQMVVYAYGDPREGDSGVVASFVFPFPLEISESVGTAWELQESKWAKAKSATAGMLGLRNPGERGSGIMGALGDIPVLGNIGRSIGNFGNILADSFVGGGEEGQRNRGLAKNTHQEYFFKSLNFREFSYTQRMYATSKDEADNVNMILQSLKWYTSPGIHGGGARYFTYPAQFEIHFISGDTDNPFLFRIGKCIMDNFEVNYTPEGGYQGLPRDEPITVEITMAFKELDLVTRETLEGIGGYQVFGSQ